jgi:hypothetical protein
MNQYINQFIRFQNRATKIAHKGVKWFMNPRNQMVVAGSTLGKNL